MTDYFNKVALKYPGWGRDEYGQRFNPGPPVPVACRREPVVKEVTKRDPGGTGQNSVVLSTALYLCGDPTIRVGDKLQVDGGPMEVVISAQPVEGLDGDFIYMEVLV